MTFHGGTVLPKVEVEVLYYGSDWQDNSTLAAQTSDIDNFFSYIVNSPYMDMLHDAGYGVGRGKFLDSTTDPADLSGDLTDSDIQNELVNEINNGDLQAPDANRLYFVLPSPGLSVDDTEPGGGYHTFFTAPDGSAINYAVVATPLNSQTNNADWGTIGGTGTHELAEAVTDSGDGWWDDDLVDQQAALGLGTEIGDIVNGQCVMLSGYEVQKVADKNDQPIQPAGATSLILTGKDLSGWAGQPVSGTVATFEEWDVSGPFGDYSAQVNFGDGQTTAGEVSENADGTFSVTADHTYAQRGNYTVQVTVTDSADNDTSTVTCTAAINGPPPNLPQAASALTHSTEYYANLVTAVYQKYLGRAPDDAGLSAWVQAMQNGLTDEHLEAGFIGSDEYIANHGGAGAGWVKGMYQDLLGRNPSDGEVQGWVDALNNGASPSSVAYGFAASAEREGQHVQANYQTILGRPASDDEVSAWVTAFTNGVTNEGVMAGFVGSSEYYFSADKGNGDTPTWVVSAYQDVLGRQPSQGEIDTWTPFLA
jgi:PKD repeat protein